MRFALFKNYCVNFNLSWLSHELFCKIAFSQLRPISDIWTHQNSNAKWDIHMSPSCSQLCLLYGFAVCIDDGEIQRTFPKALESNGLRGTHTCNNLLHHSVLWKWSVISYSSLIEGVCLGCSGWRDRNSLGEHSCNHTVSHWARVMRSIQLNVIYVYSCVFRRFVL